MSAETQRLIAEECDAIKAMLLEKNRNYGDSAVHPVRILSSADAVEQIKVRIDDKLSRIARGSAAGEDVLADLTGYFVLLRVAQRVHGAEPPTIQRRVESARVTARGALETAVEWTAEFAAEALVRGVAVWAWWRTR